MLEKIRNINSHKLFLLSLIGVAITLPFDITVNSIFIILSTVIWLASLFDARIKEYIKIDKAILAIIFSYYIFYILTVLFHPDPSESLSVLETKLSFLIFPIILLTGKVTLQKHEILYIFLFFVLAVTAACLWCHFHLIYTVIKEGVPLSSLIQGFGRRFLLSPFEIHPSYLSLYINFSLLFLLQLLLSNTFKKKSINVLIFIIFFYLIYFNFHIASRIGLGSMALVLPLQLIVHFISKKRSLIGISLVIVLLATFFFFAKSTRTTYLRLYRQIGQVMNTEANELSKSSMLGERIKVWTCAVESLRTDMLLTGYGIQGASYHLNQCYADKEYLQILSAGYNTHNEYLNTLLRQGLPGLIILIINVGLGIYFFLKKKEYLYGYFSILLILFCTVENIFSLQKGVVFFNLFNCLFIYKIHMNNLLKEKE